MPTNIGTYNWTVPDEYDPPDGPVQFTELASDIEATLKTVDAKFVPLDARVAANEAGIAALQNAPYCQVKATALKSVASAGNGTILDFPAEDFDTHGMHDNVTFNSRLTCKLAGVYMLFGGVPFVPNATGKRAALWFYNGSTAAPIVPFTAFVASGTVTSLMAVSAASILVRLNLNDYVELAGFQDSGAPLNTYWSTSYSAYAGARYVGP